MKYLYTLLFTCLLVGCTKPDIDCEHIGTYYPEGSGEKQIVLECQYH